MTSHLPILEPRQGGSRRPFDSSLLPWADPQRVPAYEELLCPDFLHAVASWLAANGGKAPGIDGVRWSDLSQSEQWQLARELTWQLQHQSFRPSRARSVLLLKLDGGYRELLIRSLPTRIVAKIAQLAIEPFFDALFSINSFGFRPRLSPWHLLASLARSVEEGLTYIGQGDIRGAFGSMSQDLALQDIFQHVAEDRMRWLLELILRKDNTHGIDQGCSFSPVALNVHLNALDWLLSQKLGCFRVLRYADNYFCIATRGTDVRDALDLTATELAKKGLTLVTDGEATDLTRQPHSKVLGFEIRTCQGRLAFSISEAAWNHLRTSLRLAWQDRRPNELAEGIACGWLGYFAPSIENLRGSPVENVLREMARAGFRSVNRGRLQQTAVNATRRWHRLIQGQQVEDVSATPPAVAITKSGEVVLTEAEYLTSASIEAPF